MSNAGRPDDRSVDGSAKNEEAHVDDEDTEGDAERCRAHHVHGHARDEVIAIDRDAHPVGDDHDGEQGTDAGEEEAVDRDDDGGTLQVFELGVLDLTVDLREGLFAAHREYGVAEGHQHTEEPEMRCEGASAQEAEGFFTEVQVTGAWAAVGEQRRV